MKGGHKGNPEEGDGVQQHLQKTLENVVHPGEAAWRGREKCLGWNVVKTNLVPVPATKNEEWRQQPLWIPYTNHIGGKEAPTMTAAQSILHGMGLLVMKDDH